jgi:hypothetical protein
LEEEIVDRKNILFEMEVERNDDPVMLQMGVLITAGLPERISDWDGGDPAEPDEYEIIHATDPHGNEVELTDAERVWAFELAGRQ